MARYGVIGASGFVGQHLCAELIQRGHTVCAIVRTAGSAPQGTEEITLGDFSAVSDWEPALMGLDAVFCLAARVHVMVETESDPLAAFRKVNVEVTRVIAQAAARCQVRRLIFVSSIKVNGESTPPDQPFRANDTPNPQDFYGISKHEAEMVLHAVAESSGLEVVIVRPPLVYGPGVGGNFLKLLSLARSGIYLPFGSVRNSRSMIAVENLVDALAHVSTMPMSHFAVALVSDADSLSTAQLLQRLYNALNRPVRLFPFPLSLLRTGFKLLGKQAISDRLLGTLEVEISSDPEGIDWKPRVSVDTAIQRTVNWYVETGAEQR